MGGNDTVGIDAVATGNEPDVRDILRSFTGLDPDQLRFRPLRVLLSELAGSVATPEAYLLDGDPAGHASVLYFVSRFERGEFVPPIIVRRGDDGLEVVDGFHRLAGAAEAGASIIDALLIVE